MDLRHLRYFVAVAEELHFTRAAEKLGISQPPLTQQIQSLEKELKTKLINRTSRRVQLTDAGRTLLSHCRLVFEALDNAVETTKRAGRGLSGNVRVGFTGSASFHPLVMSSIHAFRTAYQSVEVGLEENFSFNLLDLIRSNKLDVAFVRLPLMAKDLSIVPVAQEPMLAVVHSRHPLARKRSLRLLSLADETFIFYPLTLGLGLADAVIKACEQSGFTPRIGQWAPQMSSTINLVAAGLGVSIVPSSMSQIRKENVQYIKIRGVQPIATLGLASRNFERSEVVNNFIKRVFQVTPPRISRRRASAPQMRA